MNLLSESRFSVRCLLERVRIIEFIKKKDMKILSKHTKLLFIYLLQFNGMRR